jgi:hypothetical protein
MYLRTRPHVYMLLRLWPVLLYDVTFVLQHYIPRHITVKFYPTECYTALQAGVAHAGLVNESSVVTEFSMFGQRHTQALMLRALYLLRHTLRLCLCPSLTNDHKDPIC